MINPFNMPQAHEREAWEQIYADLTKPLLVDVGCAKGRWVEHMAAETSVRLELQDTPFNYCGIEIYGPLVEAANQKRNLLADPRRNLHYVHANIITSLKTLQLPNLHTICFQYCDPWLKKARRRTVTPLVAQQVAELLPPGGQVYLVSDYLEIASDMRSLFLATGVFREVIAVEAAAQDALAARRRDQAQADVGESCVEGAKMSGDRARWRQLPSVVSWCGQVRTEWWGRQPCGAMK